jgi:hypothetical protein
VSNLNIPDRESNAGPEPMRASREPMEDGQEDIPVRVARHTCIDCSNGVHEMSGQPTCSCPCHGNAPATVFTMDTIAAFCTARDTGKRVEVDEELFNYFLEVLPPIHMGYIATVGNGPTESKDIYAAFGFAEGTERVTAFWCGSNTEKGRYFAQFTKEVNR